jgi:hypothetical protein
MRFLNRFSSAEQGTMRFTALDFSGENVIVAGKVLYLRGIHHFVETIISEVKELLRSQLFFGLDMFDINWLPGVVHEEPRNRTIGYSCFHDPSNSFQQHRFDFLRAILTHPSLRGRFHFVSKEQKIIWKAGPCFAYMALCHEVEMLLFCGTQTSVGEPARATEIASHLIANVPGGTIRNALVMFQYFCMMGTFNKTSHFTGRDVTMMRVPHPEIGRLWMLYLTFIRPTIILWQSHFSGQKAAWRARDRLFFGPYRPVTSSELSRNLARHTQRILGIKMPVSLWRQVATWFLNYHSVRFLEYHDQSSRSSLAAQSGHSEEIHALYASDIRLPAGIDFHVFFDTMRTSGIWHSLVGFSDGLQPSLLEAMRHKSKIGLPVALPMASESNASIPSATDIAEAVKRTILPDILQAVSQSRANDLACLLNSLGMNLDSPPSQALTQPVTHMMHPSRLRDLRTFLKDNFATFKDPQQSLALELIRGKEPSLLVVGPTGTRCVCFRFDFHLLILTPGSGKTLPIFMSIGLYDGGATTIMILPLVAMHEEYKCRAQRYGLACRTWTMDCDIATTPQLLLVAVENCSWPELQDHVATLIRLGRLARIVVDEAHLLAKHEAFRPCMGMLTSFGMLAISIVLMTATCPNSLERYLFQKLGRKVYQVLRRSTDRPEISQKMIPIRTSLAGGDFEQSVAQKITSTTTFSNEAERALLFCNSRDECDRMAGLLGWRPYHSSISVEERSEGKKLWKDGAVLGLASTSMLNCCLDYPSVNYVFHLGSPRDAVDYYQAIGRAARSGGVGQSIVYFDPAALEKPTDGNENDLFGRKIIYDMLHDTSLCRRLRPGFFLDGVGVPCAMLPSAQLCDICSAQLDDQQPDPGLHRIPNNLVSASIQGRRPTDARSQLTLLPDPMNQRAPSASFSTHLAAANSCLAIGNARIARVEGLGGGIIRTACNNLAKSCIACWSSGSEFHSHRLDECQSGRTKLGSETWRKWLKTFRLPVGCCFFCGCPYKVCSGCTCGCGLRYSPKFRWFTYRILAMSCVFMNMPATRDVTGSQCLNLSRSLSFTARP